MAVLKGVRVPVRLDLAKVIAVLDLVASHMTALADDLRALEDEGTRP